MRRIRKLAAAVLLVAASVGLGAQPAAAHSVDFCAGQGAMTTSAPFFLDRTTAAQWSFTFTIGGCVLGHSNTGTGTLTGSCGLATGTVQWDTHRGTAVWSGGTIEFYGQVNGSMEMSPNAFNGESCTSGADGFLLTGGFVLNLAPLAA